MRHLRWVAGFSSVLLAISAVPVLAEDRPEGSPAHTLPAQAEDFDISRLPDGHDVAVAIDKAEEEEEQREAWISSPEAIQQREASKLSYSGLSAAESEELLQATFAELLAQLDFDPARFLSDAQLLGTGEDPTAATVKDEGQRLVMDAGNVPVRTVNEDGRRAKVDLSLEPTPEGWETKNALVDVRIPSSPEQPIGVGDNGVSIKLLGAEAQHAAQPFG
ncbi:MAG TPA: hypothetical protein VFB52_10280, partial [Solirubrobacterales bacterium]|nr:hypothetical protein [Solirubrobacterales bacterium]